MTPRYDARRVLQVAAILAVVEALLMVMWVWPWTAVVIGVLLFVSPLLVWLDR